MIHCCQPDGNPFAAGGDANDATRLSGAEPESFGATDAQPASVPEITAAKITKVRACKIFIM